MKDRQIIKVSVIIPVYNADKFLEERLETIINQTLTDIEIICVDDGSTDRSLEILNEYKKSDSRIVIIEAQHSNAGTARNEGIKIANGEYLAILDADDFSDYDMLEKMYYFAKKDELDIAVCRARGISEISKKIFKQDGAIKQNIIPKGKKNNFSPEDCKDRILQIFVAWTWDKLYRRKFIVDNQIDFQSLQAANAASFSCESVILAKKIGVMDEYLVTQRRDVDTSITHQLDNAWECSYRALLDLKSRLEKRNLFDKYKTTVLTWGLHTFVWYLSKFEMNIKIQKKYYDSLRNKFFIEFDFESLDNEILYSKKEYEIYKAVLKYDYYEYCAWEREQIKIQIDSMTSICNQYASDLASLKNEKEYLKKMYEEEQQRLFDVMNSTMFNVGAFMTYLPRKIKDHYLIKKQYREKMKNKHNHIIIVAYEDFHYFILNSIIRLCNYNENFVEVYLSGASYKEMKTYLKNDLMCIEWHIIPHSTKENREDAKIENELIQYNISKEISNNKVVSKVVVCSAEYKYHRYMPLFKKRRRYELISLVHNVNSIFRSKETNNEKYLMFKNVDKYAVLGEQLKREIEDNKLTDKPVIVTPIISRVNQTDIGFKRKTFDFVVIGHVQKERKDYELILNTFAQLENYYHCISLCLLGPANTEYGKKISKMCLKLRNNGLKIKWYDNFVETSEFTRRMNNADYILGPVTILNNASGYFEIYGKTKMTGVETDMIEYAKPAVVPYELVVNKVVETSTIRYKNESDFKDVIVSLLDDKVRWQYKKNAQENSSRINCEAFYIE